MEGKYPRGGGKYKRFIPQQLNLKNLIQIKIAKINQKNSMATSVAVRPVGARTQNEP